jgi:hypothetical protein
MIKKGVTDKSMIIITIGFDLYEVTQFLRIDDLSNARPENVSSTYCAAIVYV